MSKSQKQNRTHPDNENVKDHVSDNECPKKDKDGNCLVPGIHGDSSPIGGG